MSVRLFDWRDILTLHRYRNQSVCLDSALLLTRGSLFLSGTLLSTMTSATGVITCISDGRDANQQTSVGQLMHLPGSEQAHLTFLAPENTIDSLVALTLLDYMGTLSGERGALRLLADVEEDSAAFEALRGSGFAIYSRQRIWQIPSREISNSPESTWREAAFQDMSAMRTLYNNLVPALVQRVEPFPAGRPKGLVHYEDNELIAFAEYRSGLRGIWAQPFLHPDIKGAANYLKTLLEVLPNRSNRPVYFCVRSYQSWLETALEDLGAQAGPSQAVMVKQLAVQQKVVQSRELPSMETEVSAPFASIESG